MPGRRRPQPRPAGGRPAAAGSDPRWGDKIAATLAGAPKPGALKATHASRRPADPAQRDRRRGRRPGAPTRPISSPTTAAAIDHAQPQAIERGPAGLTLTLTPGAAFKSATPPTSLGGVLSLGDQAFEITAARRAAAGRRRRARPAAEAADPAHAGSGWPSPSPSWAG